LAQKFEGSWFSRGLFVLNESVRDPDLPGELVFPADHKPLYFPNAWKMEDLFIQWREKYDKDWSPTPDMPAEYSDKFRKGYGFDIEVNGKPPTYLNFYISHSGIHGHFSTRGVPRPEVVDFIKKGMLLIEHDTIHFSAVHRKNGETLITAQYNSIIGNRWLSLVTDCPKEEDGE